MKNTRPSYWIPADVILWVDEEGQWMASNVRTRTHIGLSEGLVPALLAFRKPMGKQSFLSRAGKKGGAWDLTRFSCLDGLSGDPTDLVRDGGAPSSIRDPLEVFQLLCNRFILIQDAAAYEQYFNLKRNMLDTGHLGNFHQRLGRELLLNKRVNPDLWWLEQKFSGRGKDLRPSLYQAVQSNFYKHFFTRKRIAGKIVLDVGCGPGFYARFLGRRGAQVHGIDPNTAYIARAKELCRRLPCVTFEVLDIGAGASLERLPSHRYDMAIFQDAMLFYFIPHNDKPLGTLDKVLGELRRCLKKNGRLYVIEPHGVFQFAPWLGATARPFTVLTEYRRKSHGITPTLAQVSEALLRNGFHIRRILEPGVDAAFEKTDPRAFHFASQFPQWWVFEAVQYEND